MAAVGGTFWVNFLGILGLTKVPFFYMSRVLKQIQIKDWLVLSWYLLLWFFWLTLGFGRILVGFCGYQIIYLLKNQGLLGKTNPDDCDDV